MIHRRGYKRSVREAQKQGYSTIEECPAELKTKINRVSYYDPSTYVDSDAEEDEKEMKGECET